MDIQEIFMYLRIIGLLYVNHHPTTTHLLPFHNGLYFFYLDDLLFPTLLGRIKNVIYLVLSQTE